jgi:protein phosphatase
VTAAPVRFELAARTDLGRTRDHNEDTFLCADLTTDHTDFLDHGRGVVGPKGALFLVADGMGGAAAGEIASAMAADIIFQQLRETWTRNQGDSAEEFILRIKEAVEVANERIHSYAAEHRDSRGMGTTATVVGVFGGRLHLAQVGDSRAYLIRGGQAAQLTKDQSLMQRLIDAGELTEEQAAQSERRNIILQALGPDAQIRVDVSYQDLARGDYLVLCSDGLSGQVKREEIGSVVEASASVEEACERLISTANERGGPDNITAVVVRFDGDALPEPSEADLGYHVHPVSSEDEPGEVPPAPAPPQPAPIPSPAASPPPTPVESVATPDAAPLPSARTGSPIVMAAVGVGVLLVLLVLFLFFSKS